MGNNRESKVKGVENIGERGKSFEQEIPEDLKNKINLSMLSHTEGMDWLMVLSEYGLR